MKVIIGGDFYISPNLTKNEFFSQDILDYFSKSDYNLVNLECPVVDDLKNHKIIKTGPHLRTDKTIYNHLLDLKIKAVTLANNHILDYGELGLKETMTFCDQNNINYLGAGLNLSSAAEPLIINRKGLKIAFVNFCENEWSVSPNSATANPMNLVDNITQIKEIKKKVDFIVVIVHGGHEHYSLPSPRMVKLYRFYADNGANAVIGHHTHCISGYEIYKEVPIVYSLGNMIFTKKNNNESWYKGQIAELNFEQQKPVSLLLKGTIQKKDTYQVTFLDCEEEENYRLNLENINTIISSDDKLHNEWVKFVKSNNKLINLISPSAVLPGRYMKGIFNRSGLSRLLMRKAYLKSVLNHIRCESHKDMLMDILNSEIYKNENRNSQ